MPESLQTTINVPQSKFLALNAKFKAFVGGFGSGKTYIGALNTCRHFWENPKINTGYFAPTFPHIRDIYFPTIEEVAFNMGQRVEIREGNREVHHYSGKQYRGTTICRSLEKPERIVGFKIAHAHIDEFDILPVAKAMLAMRKIIGRMRYRGDGLKNDVDITTTPEGFKATYNLFVANKKDSYGIVHASTYENEVHLPDDYIPSLIESYPAELISAYLEGQFVNLTSGTVYHNYKRELHRSNEVIKERELRRSNEVIKEKEPLYIGQDFNVADMRSVVCVRRSDGFHVVDHLKGVYDTPNLIVAIEQKYNGHKIIIYPDASGNSRKTVDASKSDISLLQQAGFAVRVNRANPLVKDRVLSVNTGFSKGKLWVNDKAAPGVADSLEKQAYDENGEPDKKNGFDHDNDAFGYLVAYEMPINKPVMVTNFNMWR